MVCVPGVTMPIMGELALQHPLALVYSPGLHSSACWGTCLPLLSCDCPHMWHSALYNLFIWSGFICFHWLPSSCCSTHLFPLHFALIIPVSHCHNCRWKIMQMLLFCICLQTSWHDLAFNWVVPVEPSSSCPCPLSMLSHCNPYKEHQLFERRFYLGSFYRSCQN